jgi:hypothetical protein
MSLTTIDAPALALVTPTFIFVIQNVFPYAAVFVGIILNAALVAPDATNCTICLFGELEKGYGIVQIVLGIATFLLLGKS